MNRIQIVAGSVFTRVLVPLALTSLFVRADSDPNLRQLFSSYWTIADGNTSVVELHNNLVNKPLSVQPLLLAPDGRRMNLPAVQLGPLGNASIDIGNALNQAEWGDVRWGSAIFQYSNKTGGALIAETQVTQPAETVVYTITSTEKGASPADQHAVFWLPSKSARAYITLQNTSSTAINVSAAFENAGSRNAFSSVALGPNASQLITVPSGNLWSAQGSNSDLFGAIVLSHDGPDGSLNPSGWIDDDSTGYSTMMTFWDPGRHKGTSLFTTQVFLGPQDNLLASGARLTIDSYLVVLNTSGASISPQGKFICENNGRIVQAPLSLGTLAAGQSIEVDLGALQQRGLIPYNISVGSIAINYDGPEAALMGRVFGIANDPTFGFYVALESWTPSRISESYWTTEGDTNSFLTVTNFGSQADQVNIVITYNGGTFTMPTIALQPLQSTTINARDWTNKLPPNVAYGGFRVLGQSFNTSRLLIKEHVISESQRTSTPFYGGGSYVADWKLWIGDYSTVVSGGTDYVYSIEFISDGTQYEVLPVSLTSSDASIISVTSTDVWDSDDSTYADVITGGSSGSTNLNGQSTTFSSCNPEGTPCSYADQEPVYVQNPGGVVYVNTVGMQTLGSSYCGSGKAGYRRDVTLQLVDQGTPPTRISVPNFKVADSVIPGTPNQLNIGSTQTADTNTNSYGQWLDTYTVCSSSCPGSGTTPATQSWTADRTPLPKTNSIVYGCSSITIDGH